MVQLIFPGGLFYNSEIGFFDKGEADESFDLMTVTDEGKVLRSDRRWSAGDVAYYKLGVYEANEEGRRIWTEAYERIGLLSREDLSREGGALALKKEEARCLLVESVLEQMGVNE